MTDSNSRAGWLLRMYSPRRWHATGARSRSLIPFRLGDRRRQDCRSRQSCGALWALNLAGLLACVFLLRLRLTGFPRERHHRQTPSLDLRAKPSNLARRARRVLFSRQMTRVPNGLALSFAACTIAQRFCRMGRSCVTLATVSSDFSWHGAPGSFPVAPVENRFHIRSSS
jgi:hypothetical protein